MRRETAVSTWFGFAACGLLALLLAPAAQAEPKLQAQKQGRSPAQRGAKDERLQTRDLWKLAWHGDWKAAVLMNRLQRRDRRPIVHLRILGDLAAKT
jgi:hypothetical protein